jgi:hypothetical protein
VGGYDDFDGMSFSGTTSHYSSDEFYHEDAQKELGHYNECEDLGHWTFEERFADDQWNEPNLTLQGSRNNFTGLTLGPTSVHTELPLQAEEYFLKF